MSAFGKLDRMKVAGFKSIERIDLMLNPLNILVGANGAGKSNFISLFRFLNQLLHKNLQFHIAQQLGADKLLFFGRKRTRMLEIDLEFTLNVYSVTLAPDTVGGLIFQKETCAFLVNHTDDSKSEDKNSSLLAAPGARESGLSDQPHAASAAEYVAGYLLDWKVYHFHDTSESAKVKQLGRIDETHALLPQADNLAAFLRSIRQTPAYALIIRTIQRVAPFFLDFVLEPEKENLKQIRLRWRHRGSEDTFDASDFSDGTLRFICLATLLLQPKLPSIILLDEPELGLHPYAIQLLAGMMRIASSQTQVIASTQSVTLANQFSWKDMIVVDLIDNASRFRRLSDQELEQWLDDYAIGELWEKNILGGMP